VESKLPQQRYPVLARLPRDATLEDLVGGKRAGELPHYPLTLALAVLAYGEPLGGKEGRVPQSTVPPVHVTPTLVTRPSP
jgi:hypothetical protein